MSHICSSNLEHLASKLWSTNKQHLTNYHVKHNEHMSCVGEEQRLCLIILLLKIGQLYKCLTQEVDFDRIISFIKMVNLFWEWLISYQRKSHTQLQWTWLYSLTWSNSLNIILLSRHRLNWINFYFLVLGWWKIM